MRALLRWSVAAGLVAVAALAVAVSLWLRTPLGIGGEAVEFEIRRGTSPRAVCEQLAEQGVLRSPKPFYWYLRVRRAGPSLQAGHFHVDRDLTAAQLLDALQSARARSRTLVIPEGFRVHQIAERLEALKVCSAAEFNELALAPELAARLGFEAASLEGYLYPDTYELPLDATALQVVERLTARWRQVWEDDLAELARAQGRDPHWVVTLASIVEKETGLAAERDRIAGVFLRRLGMGMKLQSDPTIIYGLSAYDGNIRRRDIQDPHPWNTYVHVGLPPTPICSPGRDAMWAVLNPAEGNELYFVSMNDGSGAHDFSVTYREHSAKVRRYLLSPNR
jgi:UPF0755 protein